jgi:hypothetical protein
MDGNGQPKLSEAASHTMYPLRQERGQSSVD